MLFQLNDFFIIFYFLGILDIGELETGLALPSSEWSKDDDVSRFWK